MATWIMLGTTLLVVWAALIGFRRRAERRAERARARTRSRRMRVPLVSANVRGQPTGKSDIWREEREAAAREEHAA